MRNCALSKLYYLIPLHIVIIDKYFKESIHPSKMFPNLRVIRLISPRRECYMKRNLLIQRRQTLLNFVRQVSAQIRASQHLSRAEKYEKLAHRLETGSYYP